MVGHEKLFSSMKYTIALLFMFPLLIGSAGHEEIAVANIKSIQNTDQETDDSMTTKIRIKVGNQKFMATLLDNASANALKSRLPLTVNMTELNGNEKYYRFSQNLPANASSVRTISEGDLMLWGSDTLVLFYETFSTSYNYTRLGKIDNPNGLATALGSGDVTVTIELE
jgi:hypothetical protein